MRFKKMKNLPTEDMLLQLADDFYTVMDTNAAYQELRDMHPEDLSRIKYDLGMYLTVMFDTPDKSFTKYTGTNIASWHEHLTFERRHGGQWLSCMKETLAKQDISDDMANAMFARFTQATKEVLDVTVR